MDSTGVLPSEKIQKEFERNPLKLLEDIRNEENPTQNNEDDSKIFDKPNKNHPDSEDINNLNSNKSLNDCNYYINSTNCKNNFVNQFNIFFNFQSNNEGKGNDNNSVNINVNNSHCQNYNVYINENFNFNFDRICNDNIHINDSFLENNLNNNVNKNVNNNIHINISKLLSNLKTYKGSIYAQSQLESLSSEKELSSFFNDIIPNICHIMCSEYGNFFFQKLIKKLSLMQRLLIYKIIQPEFLIIATNKWGTHSIQSLMDNAKSPMEIYGLNLLISNNMYILFTDDNAYHIMMKMILDFDEEKRIMLNLYMVNNIDKIITNKNGAFCVNKFITNNKNLKLRKIFLDNLKKNLKKIIDNKYCCINLLIILQTFGIEWGSFIITEIKQNFIGLLDNPVSRLFVMKVFDFLKNRNTFFLKELLWSLLRKVDIINYFFVNKSKKKILNQLIEYSDDEQKVYLYIFLKKSNW